MEALEAFTWFCIAVIAGCFLIVLKLFWNEGLYKNPKKNKKKL